MRADIVLVGFGHVGQRFAELLEEQRRTLDERYDLQPRVLGIATLRHGSVFSLEGIGAAGGVVEEFRRTAAFDSSLRGSPVRTLELIAELRRSEAPLRAVIETTTLDIGSGQPAISHIEAAIDAGCHAITANKGPAAFAYHELRARSERAGVAFLFEGAVMDGVPVFSFVRETLPAVRIIGFRGVVNSTTNYILTAIEEGRDFDAALASMQAEGIAEADASLDVDGWDAAAKTAALANVLLDARLTPRLVDRTGIDAALAPRARAARAEERRLKLVASASRDAGGRVAASVRPIELPADDVLAIVRDQGNVLVLQTDLLGSVAIHQLQGTLTMTAYALLSDLITVRRRLGRYM
jgi:homoserine dehydrogenase